MFEWLKDKSRKRSAANIAALVSRLIDAANNADMNIRMSSTTNDADIRVIRKLQEHLLFELNGPLPLAEVRGIVDSALVGSNVSEGARMAVEHVYREAVARGIR